MAIIKIILFSALGIACGIAVMIGMFDSPQKVKCSTRIGVFFKYFLPMIFSFAISFFEIEEQNKIKHIENKPHTKYHIESIANTQPQELVPPTQEEKEECIWINMGQDVQIGRFVYCIKNFHYMKTIGNEWLSKTADGIYIVISFTLKNMGDKPYTISNFDNIMCLIGPDEKFYSIDETATLYYEIEYTENTSDPILYRTFQPNITAKAHLVFEVPQKELAYALWFVKSPAVMLLKQNS